MREKKSFEYSTDHRRDPHAYDDADVRSPTSKLNFQRGGTKISVNSRIGRLPGR